MGNIYWCPDSMDVRPCDTNWCPEAVAVLPRPNEWFVANLAP